MRILHTGILCFFFSAACVEASTALEAIGFVGREVSIQCSHEWPTNTSYDNYNKYFCRDMCSSQDILLQSEGKESIVTEQGRYRMEHNRGDGVFTVSIRSLEKTDAGRYHCGVDTLFDQEVHLKVLHASFRVSPSPHFSNVSLQTTADAMYAGSYLSMGGSAPAAVTVTHPSTKRPKSTHHAGTTVIFIVFVSLAALVCALIPFIFCIRSHNGPCGLDAEKGGKDDYNDVSEEQESVPTQRAVRLQRVVTYVDSKATDADQYDAIYQALDPKPLK